MARLSEKVDYNFQVKPILSDRCYTYHGPDAQKHKGDLRFDIKESAYSALESGGGHAIVPGSIRRSQLTQRIISEDPEVMMPPPESNLSLTDLEKAILIKWVEQGAEYKPHWAFTKPEKPALPESGTQWSKNEIDRFIYHLLVIIGPNVSHPTIQVIQTGR